MARKISHLRQQVFARARSMGCAAARARADWRWRLCCVPWGDESPPTYSTPARHRRSRLCARLNAVSAVGLKNRPCGGRFTTPTDGEKKKQNSGALSPRRTDSIDAQLRRAYGDRARHNTRNQTWRGSNAVTRSFARRCDDVVSALTLGAIRIFERSAGFHIYACGVRALAVHSQRAARPAPRRRRRAIAVGESATSTAVRPRHCGAGQSSVAGCRLAGARRAVRTGVGLRRMPAVRCARPALRWTRSPDGIQRGLGLQRDRRARRFAHRVRR